MQQNSLLTSRAKRDLMHILRDLPESLSTSLERPRTKDVEPVFGQGPGLVEADDINFACDVDAVGGDAKDP